MPKRRSIVPHYTKRLQRAVGRIKIPASVVPAGPVAELDETSKIEQVNESGSMSQDEFDRIEKTLES